MWFRRPSRFILFDRLAEVHGTQWKIIGEQMERSSNSVARRFRDLTRSVNRGPWADDEHRRLEEAVTSFVDNQTRFMDRNLPWTKIADMVKTRSVTDCAAEW